MSSRQLRKLQKQRELEEAQNTPKLGQEEEEEDDEGVVDTKASSAKPRVSLFAALGGEDNDVDEEDQDDVEDAPTPAAQDYQQQPVSSETSKSKKKKKKKKAKAKATSEAAPKPADDEDEIDRAIKELKLTSPRKAGKNAADSLAAVEEFKMNELLKINTHHLRAINEMRQLFGREVMESAQTEEEQAQAQAHGRRARTAGEQQVDLETFLRGRPGERKLPELSLRRNIFIQGREHWPLTTSGGLRMEREKPRPDTMNNEYVFVHNEDYDQVQTSFYALVMAGTPMEMIHLLFEHRKSGCLLARVMMMASLTLTLAYHVSTCLQVGAIAKQDQNMALSSELCERALFALGRVAASTFRADLEQGRARFEFRRPENRQLWLAGSQYIKSLVRKGTYRTALEWAKLLFSIDHKDPYAMRCHIQFLAIRAYEAQWLIDFVAGNADKPDVAYLEQSVVLAKLQLKDEEGARSALREGMAKMPWLYCSLFQALGIDAPPSIWGVNPDTENRIFWTEMYIYLMKDLWNNPTATSLLQEVAKALEKVDKDALDTTDDPPIGLDVARLVYLEEQPSLIANAPSEIFERKPNFDFDPLPPLGHQNIFTGRGCSLPFSGYSNFGNRALWMMGVLGGPRRDQGHDAGGDDDGSVDDDDDVERLGEEGQAEMARIEAEHGAAAGAPWIDRLRNFWRPNNGAGAEEQGGPGDDSGHTGNGLEGGDEGRLDEGPMPGAWPDDNDDEQPHRR